MTPSTPPAIPPPLDPKRNSFLRGFGFAMLLQAIQIPLLAVTMMFSLAVIGVTQLAYIIPLALKAYRQHETARLQGILTAAGLVFLLNGICDVTILGNLGHH